MIKILEPDGTFQQKNFRDYVLADELMKDEKITIKKVTLQKQHLDKNDEWKRTNSLQY